MRMIFMVNSFGKGRSDTLRLLLFVYTFRYTLMNFLELLNSHKRHYNKGKKKERSDKNEQTHFG